MMRFYHSQLHKLQALSLAAAMLLACLNVVGATAEAGFLMFNEAVRIPERGAVPGHYVLTAGHKLSFIPPQTWRAEANRAERTVTLTGESSGAAMVVRVRPKLELADGQTLVEASRKSVQQRFPEGEITREYECNTGNQQGTTFELDRRFGADLQLTTRIALVPFDGGMIELELTAANAQFEKCTAAYGCLLTSFRVETWSGAKK